MSTDWSAIVNQGLRKWKGKTLLAMVCRLAWGSIVYNIWKFRNDVKFGNSLMTEEKILRKNCWEVRSRLVSGGEVKGSAENIALCLNWGIPMKILS